MTDGGVVPVASVPLDLSGLDTFSQVTLRISLIGLEERSKFTAVHVGCVQLCMVCVAMCARTRLEFFECVAVCTHPSVHGRDQAVTSA